MFTTLKTLSREMSCAENAGRALEILVQRVKHVMQVDACFLYGRHDQVSGFSLIAKAHEEDKTRSQHNDSNGQDMLRWVANRQELIRVEGARAKAASLLPDGYQAAVAVPLIHFRDLCGVLTVQHCSARRFDEEETDFLLTVAAQAAPIVNQALLDDDIEHVLAGDVREHDSFRGVTGSPGFAIGTLAVLDPFAELAKTPDRTPSDVPGECRAFRNAVAAVRKELRQLGQRLPQQLPQEANALFEVYTLLLDSNELSSEVEKRINAGNWAPGALREAISSLARIFERMDDPYLRARAEDIREIGRRILAHLMEWEGEQQHYPDQCVLVGDEVGIGAIARVPMNKLVGIVSKGGSSLSHTAVLARALGIPAVMGLADLRLERLDGYEVIVDGYAGAIYPQPSPSLRSEYAQLMREQRDLSRELEKLHDLPAETTDGTRVGMYVKAGMVSDSTSLADSAVEGVGLYRTEFSFIVRPSFPGEDEQFERYRDVLQLFAPRPVIMRTLDAGGDKQLPYFSLDETNPFLGWRGIRMSLDHPDIFLTQLRAMLRANAGLHNLRIMFPMITTVEETELAIDLVNRAHDELEEEGQLCATCPLGVMIEVPAAAYQVGSLARFVDFFSIGSNDLTQYLLAVDRDNPRVAGRFDSLHPTVIQTIKHIVDAAKEHNRPVGLCGELASDAEAAILLIGMGIDHLSTSRPQLPAIKRVIRSFSQTEARSLLERTLTMDRAQDVRHLLFEQLAQRGLDTMVRPSRTQH